MEVNNFKELERELMSQKDDQLKRVQNNITQSRSLFQAIGDLVELFFPKVVDVLLRMGGGDDKDTKTQSKYPHEN
jgi:hypothetical protein